MSEAGNQFPDKPDQPAQKTEEGKPWLWGLGLIALGAAVSLGSTLAYNHVTANNDRLGCRILDAGMRQGTPFIDLHLLRGGKDLSAQSNEPDPPYNAHLFSYEDAGPAASRAIGPLAVVVRLEPVFDRKGINNGQYTTGALDPAGFGETAAQAIRQGTSTKLHVFVTDVSPSVSDAVKRDGPAQSTLVACDGPALRWVDNPTQGTQLQTVE